MRLGIGVAMHDFRFSLLGLIGVVTFVACLLGATALVGRLVGVAGPEAFAVVLGRMLFQVPTLLVWLVGAVILLRRAKLHPLVSRYALLGIGGLFLLLIAGSLCQLWLYGAVRYGSWAPNAQWILILIEIVRSLLAAACWILLFVAILGSRKPDDGNQGGVLVESRQAADSPLRTQAEYGK